MQRQGGCSAKVSEASESVAVCRGRLNATHGKPHKLQLSSAPLAAQLPGDHDTNERVKKIREQASREAIAPLEFVRTDSYSESSVEIMQDDLLIKFDE